MGNYKEILETERLILRKPTPGDFEAFHSWCSNVENTRNGMRREALFRKAFFARVDKEWVDEAWYAILAEDYYANKQHGNIAISLIEKELQEEN